MSYTCHFSIATSYRIKSSAKETNILFIVFLAKLYTCGQINFLRWGISKLSKIFPIVRKVATVIG